MLQSTSYVTCTYIWCSVLTFVTFVKLFQVQGEHPSLQIILGWIWAKKWKTNTLLLIFEAHVLWSSACYSSWWYCRWSNSCACFCFLLSSLLLMSKEDETGRRQQSTRLCPVHRLLCIYHVQNELILSDLWLPNKIPISGISRTERVLQFKPRLLAIL